MNNKNLILVGGGGHCKSVIEAAESSGIGILGVLDLPETVGENVLGYPILGTDDDMIKYVKNAEFIITVGQIKNADLRIKLFEKIKTVRGTLATVIASTAYISKHAKIGAGTVILHGAVVNADAVVGENCIINTFANVEHDAKIGSFCHISTGVMVNGNCKIGSRTFIGSQSTIMNGIEITEDCVISAGSLVRKDLTIKGTYAGNPANLKISKKANESHYNHC